VTLNLAAGTVTGTAGFSGIQSFVGGQGSDLLVGPAATSTWNLTGSNAGTVSGASFTGFEKLNGGAGNDTSAFANGATLSGAIAGGGGTNALNYALYASNAPVTVNLAVVTATGTSGFSGIPCVAGGQGSDKLVGPAASTWNITGANTGTVSGVSFTGFENPTGVGGTTRLPSPMVPR
jgi:hypothetical protein